MPKEVLSAYSDPKNETSAYRFLKIINIYFIKAISIFGLHQI